MDRINSTKRLVEIQGAKRNLGAFCVNNKKEKVIEAKPEKDRRGTDRILNVRCIAGSLFVCFNPKLFL